jgi:hypothetical protein
MGAPGSIAAVAFTEIFPFGTNAEIPPVEIFGISNRADRLPPPPLYRFTGKFHAHLLQLDCSPDIDSFFHPIKIGKAPMHCQTLLPGKTGNVIKEDPESQYHLLQGSSVLFSVLTAETEPVVKSVII